MHLDSLSVRWRVLLGLGLVLLTAPLRAVQVTLVADAHVNSARATANSGAISNLNVGGGYSSLLQFDLGMLPSGTTANQVTRAVLLVYCNRVNTPGAVTVQPVNGPWGEYSVTYATLPALGSVVQTANVSQVGAFVAVDVTSLVQGWVTAPSTNNGVALTASAANVQFDSKENDQTGHTPVLDISLASNGPAGPAGVPGAQGPMGAAGPQGLPGLAGAKGDPGTPGATGAAGSAGPAGPSGATGLTGPTGAAGAAGSAGAAGKPGLVYQGAYLSGNSYALGDVVVYQGSSYASLIAGNHGNAPSLIPSAWGVLTSQGAAGAAGPQGPAGAPGPQGATGPQGLAGPAGPQGPAGAVGVRYRGGWFGGVSYAINDAVTYLGTTYLAQVGNTSQQPDIYTGTWAVMAAAGAMGPSGPTGAAATVKVGTVTTGAPGSSAAVSNSGSSAAAVLNFTIPQGAMGPGGGAGAPGGVDVSAASVYHSVSNSFLYYSVTSGNFSGGTDTAQVLTWVPNGCTATRLMVYSQQAQTITVRLRLGAPGAMSDTLLVCAVSPNSSCAASGSIVVGAGSFIDFSALGATGTPSPVWTALTCN